MDEEPVLTEWEDKIASAFTESVEMHKISDVGGRLLPLKRRGFQLRRP